MVMLECRIKREQRERIKGYYECQIWARKGALQL